MSRLLPIRLFERGASCCGLDFLAHVFWNKYIEFEESKEAYDRVLKILERIIRIPMHQYATFFDKYTHLSPTRPVTELVSPEKYQQFEAEAKAAPVATTEGGEGEQTEQQTEKTEEQIQMDIRTRIYNINVEIYTKTQAETNKRWPFEQEIKRPYFHVKPMDDMQLTNWRRYLDFEESEDDETRVQTLYERCLVACALYEEFWQRYARWMLSKNRVEDARSIYLRATSVFIPVNRPSLRLSFACFEEEHERVEEAREIYQKVLENELGHIETISKYANFERRQQPHDLSVALNILNEGLNSETVDAKSKAFLAVQVAKLLWHSKKSVHEARQVFQDGSTKYLDSKYFWLNYVSFELSQNDDEAEANVDNVFELVRTKSTLPQETIRDFSLRCLDFLMERGSSVSAYNKIEVEVNGPVGARLSDESKKRNADDDGLERPLKQMRVDGDSAMSVGVTYPGQQAPAQTPYYAQGQWAAYAATSSAQQYPYAYPYAQAAAAPAGQPPTTPTTAGWDF